MRHFMFLVFPVIQYTSEFSHSACILSSLKVKKYGSIQSAEQAAVFFKGQYESRITDIASKSTKADRDLIFSTMGMTVLEKESVKAAGKRFAEVVLACRTHFEITFH
jgi:hypothetical protein